MPRYEARIRLDAYVDVTVEAEDEETAREFAITAAYEQPYPEISDSDIAWIEEAKSVGPA